MILPSDILKEMVDDVVSIDRSNAVLITLNLRNHEDTEFAIDDANITTFIVEKNALANAMDVITLTAEITPTQFQQLILQQVDLYADLTIEYANRQTNEAILEEKQIIQRYKVFLHDITSLAKKYGINAFEKKSKDDLVTETQVSIRIPISMQLITEIDYNINKASFVGLLQDTSVEDAIKYIASVMQIPVTKITPAENVMKYQHFSIPPKNGGFRVLFDYIQKKYGVYSKGFRHYLSNGVMYVYPPFEMKSESTPKLTILRVSQDTYLGSINYHDIDQEGNVTIVSNTELETTNLTNVGSENDGTTKVFVRADGVIDGQVSKGKDLKLNNISASISSTNDNSITKGSAVPKFVNSTMNVYDQGTVFSETNTEIMTMGWPNSRFNLLRPGMPVSFVFDEKEVVMEKTGLIETIIHTFTKGNRHLFLCHTSLIVRVDPKQTEYTDA